MRLLFPACQGSDAAVANITANLSMAVKVNLLGLVVSPRCILKMPFPSQTLLPCALHFYCTNMELLTSGTGGDTTTCCIRDVSERRRRLRPVSIRPVSNPSVTRVRDVFEMYHAKMVPTTFEKQLMSWNFLHNQNSLKKFIQLKKQRKPQQKIK